MYLNSGVGKYTITIVDWMGRLALVMHGFPTPPHGMLKENIESIVDIFCDKYGRNKNNKH